MGTVMNREYHGSEPPDDADFHPISGLNDLLFCERRCALHRIEQV